MDPRRKRAVVFAAVPACLSGCLVPLLHGLNHSRYLPAFLIGGAVLLLTPLALSLRELLSLKKDGNPY